MEHSILYRTDICREEVGERRMGHLDGSEPKLGHRWCCPCVVLVGPWKCSRFALQTLVFLLRCILYVLALSITERHDYIMG